MWKQIGLFGVCSVFLPVGVAVMAVSGCGGPGVVHPMEIASDAGSKAVAALDANGDQSLDYDELAKAPGMRAALASIKNLGNTGGPAASESQLKGLKITAADIDARIQQWRDRKTGRMRVTCRVMHLKKGATAPLADAEVKFLPESFLGPSLTMGTGKTDKKGFATISQPSRGAGDLDWGMSPGFYRVEITKGNEIPAKFNSATTLGEEVAADSIQLTGPNVFELEY